MLLHSVLSCFHKVPVRLSSPTWATNGVWGIRRSWPKWSFVRSVLSSKTSPKCSGNFQNLCFFCSLVCSCLHTVPVRLNNLTWDTTCFWGRCRSWPKMRFVRSSLVSKTDPTCSEFFQNWCIFCSLVCSLFYRVPVRLSSPTWATIGVWGIRRLWPKVSFVRPTLFSKTAPE